MAVVPLAELSELLDDPLVSPCSKANGASCAVVPEALAAEVPEAVSPLFKSAKMASCAVSPELDTLSSELSSCSKFEMASCAVSPVVDVVALLAVVESVDDVDEDDEDDDEDEDAALCAASVAPPHPPISGVMLGGGPGGSGINCANSWLNCCSPTLPVLSGSSLA